MDIDKQYDSVPLQEIKDNALMLSLGNKFLCEASFLKKIGHGIDTSIETLRADIFSLKKMFPGEFVHEVDTDAILEELQHIARKLQNPDREINEKCTTGELGKELRAHTRSLTSAVRNIKSRVEGEDLTYSRKDSFLSLANSLKNAASYVGMAVAFTFKGLLLLVLLFIGLFLSLYLTMEKEETLLEEIAQSETYIRSQREVLSQLEKEKEVLQGKIAALRGKTQTRQDKIELLDLNVLMLKADGKQHGLESEISIQEKKLEENRKRIEEIEDKPFIKRLLRM
jgi:hypothetical protein